MTTVNNNLDQSYHFKEIDAMISFLKLFHALFLFVREMWLRDRTFRQFVRENFSFILVSAGFALMTLMFIHMYGIAKDQETDNARNEQKITHLETQLSTALDSGESRRAELIKRLDWWRDRYLESLENNPQTSSPPPATKEMPNQPPAPSKQPKAPIPTTRAPSADMVDRWKRLNQ